MLPLSVFQFVRDDNQSKRKQDYIILHNKI